MRNVRIELEVYDKLAELARNDDRTVQATINRALAEWLSTADPS